MPRHPNAYRKFPYRQEPTLPDQLRDLVKAWIRSLRTTLGR
jgi:hypothetical protein